MRRMTFDDATIEWRISPGLSDYADTLAEMEARAAAIREGTARELVWLLEHPPLYTAGTSAAADELLAPDRFPVFRAGRGGRQLDPGDQPGDPVVFGGTVQRIDSLAQRQRPAAERDEREGVESERFRWCGLQIEFEHTAVGHTVVAGRVDLAHQ